MTNKPTEKGTDVVGVVFEVGIGVQLPVVPGPGPRGWWTGWKWGEAVNQALKLQPGVLSLVV